MSDFNTMTGTDTFEGIESSVDVSASGFIEEIESVLAQNEPSPDALSTLIGKVIGEDPLEDDQERRGHILALRQAGKLGLLLQLSEALEHAIASVPPEDRDFVAVYQKMAAKARLWFTDAREFVDKPRSPIELIEMDTSHQTWKTAGNIFARQRRPR